MKLDHALSSCIVEMVYVVKVVHIVGSLYSMMPAPQSQTSLGSLGICEWLSIATSIVKSFKAKKNSTVQYS